MTIFLGGCDVSVPGEWKQYLESLNLTNSTPGYLSSMVQGKVKVREDRRLELVEGPRLRSITYLRLVLIQTRNSKSKLPSLRLSMLPAKCLGCWSLLSQGTLDGSPASTSTPKSTGKTDCHD